MTLKEFIGHIKNTYPSIQDLREIEDLLGFYLKLSWGQLKIKNDQILGVEQREVIIKAVERLASGEPLAYITGTKFFYKSEFLVNPDVLIPRPETEILVEEALQMVPLQDSCQIMDLGAGSGCIGLSIAKERPNSNVYLIESSKAALVVAQANREKLGLRQVQFFHGSVGDPQFQLSNLGRQIDLIVANPPYIAQGDQRVEMRVHNFEPHQALYADNQGLMWIHKWLIWGYDYLKPGGVFIFEFGQNQEQAILALLKGMAYTKPNLVKDYAAINRFMIVHKEE